MPLARPTLAELKAQVAAELATRLGLGALLPRGFLLPIAYVQAGRAHLVHGFLENAAKNFFPDTAESEFLERWGQIIGVGRLPAAKATGRVLFTGTNGSTIPTGTELSRADGTRYLTTESGVIAGGDDDVAVEAVEAGVGGNLSEGAHLSLASPVAGVDELVVVEPGGLGGGADQETDSAYRPRVLANLAAPKQGGAAKDYLDWTLEVPGVTRAWVLPDYLGRGTVGVTFAADEDPSGPIPPGALVDEVAAYLEDSRRPVTAEVIVFAPLEEPLTLEIHLFPNSLATREAVTASLSDLLAREGGPGSTLYLSHLREAVSIAAGEIDHEILLVNGAAPADVLVGAGSLTTLDPLDITWS